MAYLTLTLFLLGLLHFFLAINLIGSEDKKALPRFCLHLIDYAALMVACFLSLKLWLD